MEVSTCNIIAALSTGEPSIDRDPPRSHHTIHLSALVEGENQKCPICSAIYNVVISRLATKKPNTVVSDITVSSRAGHPVEILVRLEPPSGGYDRMSLSFYKIAGTTPIHFLCWLQAPSVSLRLFSSRVL